MLFIIIFNKIMNLLTKYFKMIYLNSSFFISIFIIRFNIINSMF